MPVRTTDGRRKGRLPRRRVVLLTIHVIAAVTGLFLWGVFLILGPGATVFVLGAVVCAVIAVIAVSHGLVMVSRWVPGHGRHAVHPRRERHSGAYFPVHTAAQGVIRISSPKPGKGHAQATLRNRPYLRQGSWCRALPEEP